MARSKAAAPNGAADKAPATADEAPPRYGNEQPYTVTLKLRGVTPFLFSRFQLDGYAESGPGQKRVPRKGPTDFEEMVWRDDDGQLAYPVTHVIAALCSGGRYFRSPIANNGSARNTLTEGLVPGAEYATFGVKTWDAIDRRMARNSDAKRSPKPTYRPMLRPGWLLSDIHITMVLPELYAPARLLEILTRAGSVCGMGDGRRIGMGRFVIGGHDVAEGLPWE